MVYLVVGVIAGAICAAIANSKGRSGVGWFFIGFFFGLIGIILAAVMSDERERERARIAARSERRRLREQLRQEKMKNEAYRRHSAARLDTHDRALGMDTRRADGLPAGHGLQASAPPALPAAKEWFYEVAGTSEGPVSEAAIRRGLAQGKIDGSTLLWRDGMEDWVPAAEVGYFDSSFGP